MRVLQIIRSAHCSNSDRMRVLQIIRSAHCTTMMLIKYALLLIANASTRVRVCIGNSERNSLPVAPSRYLNVRGLNSYTERSALQNGALLLDILPVSAGSASGNTSAFSRHNSL